jgi:hypothetical protein
MRRVILFGEDHAHEVFLRTLLGRVAEEEACEITIDVRSAMGGHGRMVRELQSFVAEVRREIAILPDLLIVARDANCEGYTARHKEILGAIGELGCQIVVAIPDPHIERWLLIDSRAFKSVLRHGCQTPDQKCDRNRYKHLLDDAVRAAGVEPLLGGIEFADDIVAAMQLGRAAQADSSFRHLLRDLRAAFRQWKT